MIRKPTNQLGAAWDILYEILQLVENDEIDYSKKCNWTYVKSKLSTVSIYNVDDYVIIENEKGTLKLYKSGVIASTFLKSFRDAFAHNFITYNENTKVISVDLKSKFKHYEVLKGEIELEVLKEIVKLIKESRNQKETNK